MWHAERDGLAKLAAGLMGSGQRPVAAGANCTGAWGRQNWSAGQVPESTWPGQYTLDFVFQ